MSPDGNRATARTVAAPTWTDAIAHLEASLAHGERLLDGVIDDPPPPLTLAPTDRPTPDEAARVQELLARLDDLVSRIAAARGAASDAIAAARTERTASRRYGSA